ncbi:hypothetical protein DL96DRAFT_712051 [Flagelloscypha sp. PMI_526]|nr:hypothetical protein DL96DRAFT_712051 [Flagelloscypha sp. PMI_526]
MPGLVSNGLNSQQLKKKTTEHVQRESRGASAASLLGSARTQFLLGEELQAKGQLVDAYVAFAKTATLTRLAVTQVGISKDQVMQREIMEFMKVHSGDLTNATEALAQRIDAAISQPIPDDSEPSTAFLSLADRKKALATHGLAIENSSSAGSISEKHAFVDTKVLNPLPPPTRTELPVEPKKPQPLRKPSADIHIPTEDEFASQYPEIDDIVLTPRLPSAPTHDPSKPLPKPIQPTVLSPPPTSPIAPVASPVARRFSVTDNIQRPGSTPLTPSSSFASRPASPTMTRKSSRLIPNTSLVNPPLLKKLMQDHAVLLVDMRHRRQFDESHIRSNSIICLEPTILMRDGITAERIEEALVVGPPQEVAMFSNRDKFDVVAMYDDQSTEFGEQNSLPNILVRAVFEQAFKKPLKHIPMLLVGGFAAWKSSCGSGSVESSSSSSTPSVEPRTPTFPMPITPSASLVNGFSGISSASTSASATPPIVSPTPSDPHQVWSPPPASIPEHRSHYSMDSSSHARSPAEFTPSPVLNGIASPPRKPPSRPPSRASLSQSQPPLMNGSKGVTYPTHTLQKSISGTMNGGPPFPGISPPPQASINPSPLTRRRSDYIDQSQEALGSTSSSSSPALTHQSFSSISFPAQPNGQVQQGFRRQQVTYPELASSSSPQPPPTGPQVLRPPPPAAPPSAERQRPSIPAAQQSSSPYAHRSTSSVALVAPEQPRIGTAYPVVYWNSSEGSGHARTGLKNLGNTCYMNATVQCLFASLPVVKFFTETKWQSGVNMLNAMGTKGLLTGTFAKLIAELVRTDVRFLSPNDFRKTIAHIRPEYQGSDQHDSQEFLSFLLDGIHEDMNRVLAPISLAKTPEEEEELERLPVNIASEKEWHLWKQRNDSIIVDYFQGQFRNRLECLTCHKTSTTYNVFSLLQVPIPHSRSSQKIPLQNCLDALFNTEILEKDDAWDCPRCKKKQRARKQLSLARLPPILIIHLKRFETHGRFSDKIDNFVEFPMRGLDLTGFMPTGTGAAGLEHVNKEDPRAQVPPYKYDLYGVTNHYGNLSSGHYTAWIQSRDKWLYCDDSNVKESDPAQVVGQKAYVLFYKRTRFY